MKAQSACIAGVAFITAVLAAGEPARRQFPAIQVTDLAGQSVDLRKLLGSATVLNFWATWCGPCRLELPELQKLYNEFGGKGLVVLAVDLDLPAAPEEEDVARQLALAKPRLEDFFKRSGITLPVYLVDGKTQVGLDIEQIPLSVLLDRNGGVVRIYPGYSAESVVDLRRQVLGILAEPSGQRGK